MKPRTWKAAALAAGLWGCIGGSAASPEYLKDPAVRAAVEQNLKTSDPAEIRRRWGSTVDLIGTPWARSYESGKRLDWFHWSWAVQGAVVDYVQGSCREKKCTVHKAVMVHNPVASTTTTYWNLWRKPAFDVLWESGNHSLGVLMGDDGMVKFGLGYWQFERGELVMSSVRYKPMPATELFAATGYRIDALSPGTAATVAAAAKPGAAQAVAAPAAEPVARATSTAGTLGVVVDQRADPADLKRMLVFVASVLPGTPAAAAGLAPGDIVQRIGDVEPRSVGDFQRAVLASPGKEVQIAVLNNGKPLVRTARLGATTLAVPCLVIGLGNVQYQYAGQCQDGFAHGRGELSYPAQEHGRAVTASYSGDFARGYMEGQGKLKTESRSYEGAFAANQRHGHGKFAFTDGRAGYEGEYARGEPVGLKPVAEALVVCARPDGAGNFRCDTPQHAGVAGGPAAKGKGAASPEALVASLGQACPSQRRLPSRTHLVWGCGFGATNAPGAMDRGAGVETRGRGSYLCREGQGACRLTEPFWI